MNEWTKNFNGWNIFKSQRELELGKTLQYFTGEIWWCAVGINLGSEIDGKHLYYERPVLVAKRCSNNLFFGIPLTSKLKHGSFFTSINYNGKVGTAVLAQARMMSSKRLLRSMCIVEDTELRRVLGAFVDFLLG